MENANIRVGSFIDFMPLELNDLNMTSVTISHGSQLAATSSLS